MRILRRLPTPALARQLRAGDGGVFYHRQTYYFILYLAMRFVQWHPSSRALPHVP